MNVGEPVVGWVDQKSLRRSANLATSAAIFQTVGMLCFGVFGFMMSAPLVGWGALVLAVFAASTFGWLASLQWRALKCGWGTLHARLDGADVILGNPFDLAFGKKRKFARSDTVRLAVANRTLMGRPVSEWTIVGTGATVVAKSLGMWTQEHWYELAEGLQRLGFTVITEPQAAGSHASTPGG